MSQRVSENPFNNYAIFGWDRSFCNDTKTFSRNGDYFPIDVFFSTFVATTPILVALAFATSRPIFNLTFSRAVGSFLASTTQFEKRAQL